MRQTKTALYHHTRGEWKAGELKWCVLGMLRQLEREVERGEAPLPFLTAYRLQTLIGGNCGSLKTLLKKWSTSTNKVIHRQKWSGLYCYTITPRGNVCFEIMTNGYLRKRRGRPARWVQIDAKAVLRRLPAYQERNKV